MRYWWVNQNQTFVHETKGGYLWSPKRKKNGRNPFYEFMREVAPDDIIFSFADTLIRTIGIARSNAYEAPKPLEFGQAGAYWDQIGWRVDVSFIPLKHVIRPSDHISVLRPHLPSRYSPLRPENGHGLQSVYLTSVPESLALVIVDLIGREARDIVQGLRLSDVVRPNVAIGLAQWEEHELEKVVKDKTLSETQRQSVVLARRGQGLFKQNVMKRETRCRLTLVDRSEHLRASHCKPWRDSNNDERLAGDNGLLLTPDADHLFDRGFISFDDNGDVLVSPVAHQESLAKMGLDPASLKNVGKFSSGQSAFLQFHRDQVFLKSRLNM